jgi:hypothetical protein
MALCYQNPTTGGLFVYDPSSRLMVTSDGDKQVALDLLEQRGWIRMQEPLASTIASERMYILQGKSFLNGVIVGLAAGFVIGIAVCLK